MAAGRAAGAARGWPHGARRTWPWSASTTRRWRCHDPPLTTVHQSPEQMGREMATCCCDESMADPDVPAAGGCSRPASWCAAAADPVGPRCPWRRRMPRVLLATSSNWPDGEPGAPVLVDALARRDRRPLGRRDDPDVDWGAADLVAVRSTWDYTERRRGVPGLGPHGDGGDPAAQRCGRVHLEPRQGLPRPILGLRCAPYPTRTASTVGGARRRRDRVRHGGR